MILKCLVEDDVYPVSQFLVNIQAVLQELTKNNLIPTYRCQASVREVQSSLAKADVQEVH